MSRESTTVTQVTCDGCGRTIGDTAPDARLWRRFDVRASSLGGELRNAKSIDLCPPCQERVSVPGLETGE